MRKLLYALVVDAAVIIVIVLVTGGTLAAQDDDTITTRHVAGPIYLLTGRGGNIGVSVGNDGILMVDDKFAPLAGNIRAALAELGQDDLAFLLNTHYHGDHTGGNAAFGTETPIIAHTNVRRRLANSPPEALPVITFDDRLSIHFNGEEIRVIHFAAGHTDGDIVVFFTGSGVVHMGDHFFNGGFPYVDLDGGGDVEGLIRNIAQLIEQLPVDVKIIPGHGSLANLSDLKAYHRMLLETTDVVRQAMQKGRSLAETQKIGLPDKWASWAGDFVDERRWIEIITNSLAR